MVYIYTPLHLRWNTFRLHYIYVGIHLHSITFTLEYIYTPLHLRWNTFTLHCHPLTSHWQLGFKKNLSTLKHSHSIFIMDQCHGQYWQCIVVLPVKHMYIAIHCSFVIIWWRNGKWKCKIFLVSWYGKETISPTSQANCQFVQSVQNIMFMSQFPLNNTSLTSLNNVQYCSTSLTSLNILFNLSDEHKYFQVSISENTPINSSHARSKYHLKVFSQNEQQSAFLFGSSQQIRQQTPPSNRIIPQ